VNKTWKIATNYNWICGGFECTISPAIFLSVMILAFLGWGRVIFMRNGRLLYRVEFHLYQYLIS